MTKPNFLITPTRLLPVSTRELSLAATLKSGQSFRWSSSPVTILKGQASVEEGDLEWAMGFKDRTVVLRQISEGILYSALYPPSLREVYLQDHQSDSTREIVRNYLALDVKLEKLYDEWVEKDANFAKKRKFPVRVLRQDPWETLIGFICSSNNNIARITLMISKLCAHLGKPLPTPSNHHPPQFSFPSPKTLVKPSTEQLLRQLGFGYRAQYVYKTAKMLLENHSQPMEFLESLKTLPIEEAREELLKFSGVGPKVADCISLFGLNFNQIVPVDTHVWQIACRDYKFSNKLKKDAPISKEMYNQVKHFLQKAWGPYAGWAQQILFTADLKSFATFQDPVLKTIVKTLAIESSASNINEEAMGLNLIETKVEESNFVKMEFEALEFSPISGSKRFRSSNKRVRSVNSNPYPSPASTVQSDEGSNDNTPTRKRRRNL